MALQLPEDFAASMQNILGAEYPMFQKALEEEAPVSIRLNPCKTIPDRGTMIPWCSQGRYLPERPVFTLDPCLHAGAYYVQEASSMFLEQAVRQHADLRQDLKVLDLCAAPGGKSTHLLSLLSPGSLLVSNEVIRSRAGILTENIQKWGYHNAIVTSNDPSDFTRLPGYFDVIVLDAPCSGEGLFRKDPAAIEEWSADNVRLCSQRQERILHDVWPALKEGGLLMYSTCTYEEHENLDNLIALKNVHDFESLTLDVPDEWNIAVREKAGITGYQFYPHRVKGEGFFLSVLRKKEATAGKSGGFSRKIQGPEASVIREVSNWVDPSADCYWIQHHETVHMLPGRQRDAWLQLQPTLNVVYAGTAVATITRNKLLPEHTLALSIHLKKDSFPSASLSIGQALEYLRKNTLHLEGSPGMTLIMYEGLALGWMNVLQNRSNNLYPVNWRVKYL